MPSSSANASPVREGAPNEVSKDEISSDGGGMNDSLNSSVMAMSLLKKRATLRPSEQRIVERYQHRK